MSQCKAFVLNSFLVLAMVALTACGGGGGGKKSTNNNIDKVEFASPTNGAQITNLNGNFQLRTISPYERNTLVVLLNNQDVTAYFNRSDTVPFSALQGLLNEGVNTLGVGARGQATKTISFSVDVVKPTPIISSVANSASTSSFNMAIRKAAMMEATYTTPSTSAQQPSGMNLPATASTATITLPNPGATDNTTPDISFSVRDNSVALPGGAGNTAELKLALPGRKFNAAGALQVNNAAFDVVEAWIPEIFKLALEKFSDPSDAFLLMDFATAGASGQNVCSQFAGFYNNNGATDVQAADRNTCQVFLSNLQVANTTDLVVDMSVKGSAIDDSENSIPNSARVDVSVQQAAGSHIAFNADVVIYKNSDYIASPSVLTKMATIRLPMKLSSSKFTIEAGLAKSNSILNDNNSPQNINLVLRDYIASTVGGVIKRVDSKVVVIEKGPLEGSGTGECIDENHDGNAATLSCPETATNSGVKAIIENGIVNAIAGEVNTNLSDIGEVEVKIDEAISVALFCDVDGDQVTAGHDNTACDGTEIAAAKSVRSGILYKAETKSSEIKHESTVVATRTDTSEASAVQPVDGNMGLFVQLAASSLTEKKDASGASVTNTDFKQILGTLFKRLEVSGLSQQNLGTGIAGDVFMATTANSLNQFLVSYFQAGLIDKQAPKLNMCNVFGGCDGSQGGGLYFDPAQNNLPFSGFTMPKIGRYDEAHIKLKLDSMPMVRFVHDAAGGYVELTISGLDVKADIKPAPTSNFDYTKGVLCTSLQTYSYTEQCFAGNIVQVAVGDNVPNALDMQADVTARLRLQKDPITQLPKLAIAANDISLSIISMKTFLDAKYEEASNRAQSNIAFIPVKDALFQQLITANDMTGLVSEGLKPILSKLSAQLVQENVYTFSANNLGLAQTKQLDAVLTSFAVNSTGDYLIFAADVCDNTVGSQTCPAGAKGLVTLKITN